jgi:heat-inducible transcriptional repressor
MSDLEAAGLLYAPHTSAGRLPTAEGLRFFVNGLLEVGDIAENEKNKLEEKCQISGNNISTILEEATNILSGFSKCAGIITVPKTDALLKHVEFIPLGDHRILVILVTQDGIVENRLIDAPQGVSVSVLKEATNYLNFHLSGKTLSDVKNIVDLELREHKDDLDVLTRKVIEAGLAVWAGGDQGGSLIVKGQSNLLQNVAENYDLEQIRELFAILDTKANLHQLIESSIQADGIQIFIGSENNLFNLSGCSLVVSPYQNNKQQIIGAIGVIGPARMNYGKIIPLVDYTAKLVGRLLG